MQSSSRSTSILIAVIVWSGIVFAGCNMCGGKKQAIATLDKAEGPVERQGAGETGWGGAVVGTQYFLGDAAKTGEGAAQLSLTGGAQIGMTPHTVLRFGGQQGQSRISVELGAIDLSGSGNIDLDVGAVKLGANGKVRITAGKGGKDAEIKLTLGTAEVTSLGGVTTVLELDKPNTIKIDGVTPIPVADAGVADAEPPPPDAPPDAAVQTAGA